MKSCINILLLTFLSVVDPWTTGDCLSSSASGDVDFRAEKVLQPAGDGEGTAKFSTGTIAVPAPGSRYYYVSPAGNDANPGTKALPMKTIGKAADAARAGDVVLIGTGVYYENLIPSHSGESERYLTFQNEGNGEVVFDAQGGRRGACIQIDNRSYLRFLGLTVRGANSYSTWPRAGISMTDGTHHIILDNITAYNNYFGIMAYGRNHPVSFITVRHSKTFGPGNVGNIHYGIFFYGRVYESEIVNNHVAYTLPEVQSYGIEISTDYPGNQADGARQIVIKGNEVDHNESQGIHTWNAVGVRIAENYLHDNGATGIQVEDGSENIVVEENLSENNAQKYEFEAGAWIDDSKNVVVRSNILRGNEIGLTITRSDRVIVHDNYVCFNNREAKKPNNSAGLIVEDSVSNISVIQNTFHNNGGSRQSRGGVNFGIFNPGCTGIIFKNNIVSQTGNVFDLFQDSCSGFISDFNAFFNTRFLAVQWNGKQMDWPEYLAASGQDRHSVTDARLVADPEVLDFSLRPGRFFIRGGTVLTRTRSAGRGATVPVTDASCFADGFKIGNGDPLIIGASRANIVAIDYQKNFITVDRVIKWENDDAVSFPYTGISPDIGAGNLNIHVDKFNHN